MLYSPHHNLLPFQLTFERWQKVIGIWIRRLNELFTDLVMATL